MEFHLHVPNVTSYPSLLLSKLPPYQVIVGGREFMVSSTGISVADIAP